MAAPKLNKGTVIAGVEALVAVFLLMHAYKTIK